MKTSLARSLLTIFLGTVVSAAGCNKSGPTGFGHGGKPKVVATFSVLGDFLHNVAGDQVELITLVGPDGDTHTFEPTPSDSVALANADIVVENGVGLEPWLDSLYSSAGSKADRIVATKGLALLKGDDDDKHDHQAGKKEADHDQHGHEDYDPHVWHDVKNVVHMVEQIRDGLAKRDPAHAEVYKSNAAAYSKQLEDLDKWVVIQLTTIPPANRKLVTNHDTFGYFAHRYGFEVVGTALGSLSTETGDPSAAAFAKLCEAIKATKVPAIFAENVNNAQVMQRLAKEAGVKLSPLLYTDALGKPDSEGGTYLKMMRYNVTTIVSQLKP